MWRGSGRSYRGRGRHTSYRGAHWVPSYGYARGGRYNHFRASQYRRKPSRGVRRGRGRGTQTGAPVARKPGTKPTGIINIDGSTYTICSGRKSLQRVPDAVASGENDMRVRMIRRLIEERKALEVQREAPHAHGGKHAGLHRDKVLLPEQYCLFYIRFGKCDKIDSGCPYVHDTTKIAVCKKYLRGACQDGDKCLLTHAIDPEKMPVCWHFLRGICLKDPCPYRHVKVSDEAPVCKNFQKGFCADGDKCLHQHILVSKYMEAKDTTEAVYIDDTDVGAMMDRETHTGEQNLHSKASEEIPPAELRPNRHEDLSKAGDFQRTKTSKDGSTALDNAADISIIEQVPPSFHRALARVDRRHFAADAPAHPPCAHFVLGANGGAAHGEK
eukprot:m.740412 g.740412  ORF g.740412 m.740412 type:complete len:385 (+) comp23115_c1_seq4:185-1339(+)